MPAAPLQLFARLPRAEGAPVPVEVAAEARVADLRAVLTEQHGAPQGCALHCGGAALCDAALLADAGLCAQSVVEVTAAPLQWEPADADGEPRRTVVGGEYRPVLATAGCDGWRSGLHRWRVRLDSGRHAKLGVAEATVSRHTGLGTDSCGWAVYSTQGEVRHATGGDGTIYSSQQKVCPPFRAPCVAELTLDMGHGTLTIATADDAAALSSSKVHTLFTDPMLRQGAYYPAVGLWTTGDRCTLLNDGDDDSSGA